MFYRNFPIQKRRGAALKARAFQFQVETNNCNKVEDYLFMWVGTSLSAPKETLDIEILRADKRIPRRTLQDNLLKEKLCALKVREMHFRLLNVTLFCLRY